MEQPDDRRSPYVPETFPHRWLPADAELKTWEQIEPWYRKLLDRPIDSPEDLERWLFDVGELNAAVGAGGGRALHRHDLPDRRPRARGGPPGVRPRHRAEAQAAPERDPREVPRLAPPRRACRSDRYHVFDRAQENRRALYREANIPRETELAELEQQYQKIIGAMTVHVPGPGAHPRADGPVPRGDRPRRSARTAWELVAARRLADRDTLDDLFDRMIALRVEIAREAGFANFVDYAYRHRERFDYGVGETPAFQDAIEQGGRPAGPPAPGRAPQRRSASSRSGPGTSPSTRSAGRRSARSRTSSKLAEGTEAIFTSVDPELGPAVRLPARRTACSTWPTARGRPPAATRRRSRTTACRSSS